MLRRDNRSKPHASTRAETAGATADVTQRWRPAPRRPADAAAPSRPAAKARPAAQRPVLQPAVAAAPARPAAVARPAAAAAKPAAAAKRAAAKPAAAATKPAAALRSRRPGALLRDERRRLLRIAPDVLGRTGWGGRSASLRPPTTVYRPALPDPAQVPGLGEGEGERAPGHGGYRVLGVAGDDTEQLLLLAEPPAATPTPTFGATLAAPVRLRTGLGSRLAPLQVDGGEDEEKKTDNDEEERKPEETAKRV